MSHRIALTDRARLALVLLAVMAIGLGLRVPELFAGLPGTPHPDEGTTVTRAWAALQDGQLAIPLWDWPPLSAHLLAAVAWLARATGIAALPDPQSLFPFGRVVFLAIAVAVIGATSALAYEAAERRDRHLAGLFAGLLLAVSFVAVRSARTINPDHLQMLFVAVSVTLGLQAERRGARWPWLAAAGAVAGLAAATKYLGALAAVTAVLVALGRTGWGPRVRGVGAVGMAGLVGFVAGTSGTAFDVSAVAEGLRWQFRHQAEGHLGFEATDNALWFHITQSWVGNWGAVLTALMVVALVAIAWRGTRRERLVAAPLGAFLAFTAITNVRFPHYILPGLPLAAVVLGAWLPRTTRLLVTRLASTPADRPPAGRYVGIAPTLAVTVLILLVVPTVLHDVRLVRHASVIDTRGLVDQRLQELALEPDDVLAESYASETGAQVVTFVWPDADIDVLACDCVALISSFQEGRYRRLPGRYTEEIAVYDAMRTAGRVIDVVGPDVELSYRWDSLPQWGVGDLPLFGEPSPTGPTVTILDLRTAPT